MSQESLDMFSLPQLKEIKRLAKNTKTRQQFLKLIDRAIKIAEEKTYNDRFRLSEITTFDNEERAILENNGLYTMTDLINCQVHNLQGITKRTQESLGWAQTFYDLSDMDHQKSLLRKKNIKRGMK